MKMKKSRDHSTSYINNNSGASGFEEIDQTLDNSKIQILDSEDNGCSSRDMCDVQCDVIDVDSEDADDVNNDSDTTSSFSLQECMDEFRARRIRRSSTTQHRTHSDRKTLNNGTKGQGTTELDLINQNLCNRQQERKFKPCENGFCYCFTSDSGDGGGNLSYSRNEKILGRNKRMECIKVSNSDKMASTEAVNKEHRLYIKKPPAAKDFCLKTVKKETNILKAVSSLEAGPIDGPIIHIIQEISDKCVISKVKVNTHNIHSIKSKAYKKGKSVHAVGKNNYFVGEPNTRDASPVLKYTPTAPIFEAFSDLESNKSKIMKNIKKTPGFSVERSNRRGLLLRKRLSASQIKNIPHHINKAPPKPPRNVLSYNEQYCRSSTSTSSSVREAERIVDDFLSKKYINLNVNTAINNNTKLIKRSAQATNTNEFESCKRKSYPLTSETKKSFGNIISTYPSLGSIEKIEESTNLEHSDKYITPDINNVKKVLSTDWNESKIKDMLNYDIYKNKGEFQSMHVQAQPQQDSSAAGTQQPIGWQLPSKINLDTVDGNVDHNLESNFEDKNTPGKNKFNSPSQYLRNEFRNQASPWSEQLRNLSPWSNKAAINSVSKDKLRSNSVSFLMSSKKKLLRLVSPKKRNMDQKGVKLCITPFRNVAVQTSFNNISDNKNNMLTEYQHTSAQQSPPGSYHSPMQSLHIQHRNKSEPDLFDFSRTVHSPPKKGSRSSNRKLNFPLNRTLACKMRSSENVDIYHTPELCSQEKTYHSFNSELDQDASISKISYILSNIRAKLEAKDEKAVRTFLETSYILDNNSPGIDCPDGCDKKFVEDTNKYSQQTRTKENYFTDPIYSEIEDDQVLLSQSPEFDNHTGIQHFVPPDNPDILYAKVNKSNKYNGNQLQFKEEKPKVALAKIMKDSLKSKKIITNFVPLPTLPEPAGSESTSYSLPLSSRLVLSQSQSLNNVRIMEHNASPKKQQYLSKSDLSLHRSGLFLENLYKSELVAAAGSESTKIENYNKTTISSLEIPIGHKNSMATHHSFLNDIPRCSPNRYQETSHNDSVSYELPNNEADVNNLPTARSSMESTLIDPPLSTNQSTPKRSYVTKDTTAAKKLNLDAKLKLFNDQTYSNYSNTARHQIGEQMSDKQNPSGSLSMDEVLEYEFMQGPKSRRLSAICRYNSLKSILQNSFRKSKTFIKKKRNHLSTSSRNFTTNKTKVCPGKQSYTDLWLNAEGLLTLNESAPINEQIVQAVSICRKLPDLTTSMEMVEAERLLLFSALHEENQVSISAKPKIYENMKKTAYMKFFIDDLFLPITSDPSQDIFFNYFYIVTFKCGDVIKSTQSSECLNGTVTFSESGIEFVYSSEFKTEHLEGLRQNAVKCNIFMLRLRKICTSSFKPKKKTIIETLTRIPSATLKSASPSLASFSSFSSAESVNDITSRFRLQASFILNAEDFVPYEYVHQESNNSDRICIRASGFCTLPLITRKKFTNLSEILHLKGRSEVRFPKHTFNGFLNVQDPHKQHDWNRRWCSLNGIFLNVWRDRNVLNTSPLLSIDLRDTKYNIKHPLTYSSREICARPRSFSLTSKTVNRSEDISVLTIFFAADTQEIVDDWLKNLNIVLKFITTWL